MVELIDIFLQAKSTDKLVLERPGLGKALLNWFVVSILLFIVSVFWVSVYNFALSAISGSGDPITNILVYSAISAIGIILGLPIPVLYSVLAYLTGKILGGKGAGLSQYFSIYLLASASILLIEAIIFPFFLIPIFAIIPALLLVIYGLYLQGKLAASYFSFSTIRGIASVVIPAVVILALVLIVVLITIFAIALTTYSTLGTFA